ncbi:MAG: glycosyltransferase family protein [Propylenella sp.]
MSNRQPRMLIYSHDSFGLGHLRRCRAIAQSLVSYREDLSILMIAGSPIVGAFSFSPNVDFIRVPGVVKLANESYQPHSPGISIEDLMGIRSSIILETARVFEPDIFLVDKEPLGLRGEVEATLNFLKRQGKLLVLGLRDVMDDPAQLAEEWERKHSLPALEHLYDHIWIYGLSDFYDPLTGIAVSDSVRQKTRFTGYLRRGKTPSGLYPPPHEIEEPFLLVTTGGGGDGAMLVDWVLRAYEVDPTLDMPAKIVFGPFMGTSQQTGFMERVARLKHLEAIAFEANMEALMQRASGVVAMGGYNTFCEILSMDKRALILPRTMPRAEQFIRAARAEELGLVSMLLPDDTTEPRQMAEALRALLNRRRPSKVHIPGLLDGLSVINSLVDQYLGTASPAAARQPRFAVV